MWHLLMFLDYKKKILKRSIKERNIASKLLLSQSGP